jgi:hypothetical protein
MLTLQPLYNSKKYEMYCIEHCIVLYCIDCFEQTNIALSRSYDKKKKIEEKRTPSTPVCLVWHHQMTV